MAVASVGVGLVMRDGGDGGFMLYAALVVMGAGVSLGFSPLLTRALANVRPEDAADASGVLVNVTQLGQLIGVATFGTLYLNRLDTPGAHGSGHALWVCALVLSAAAIVGVSVGLVRRRQRGDSQQGCPPCGVMAESDRRRGRRTEREERDACEPPRGRGPAPCSRSS